MTLIERLEAAPEGSREFDAEIAISLGWRAPSGFGKFQIWRMPVTGDQTLGDTSPLPHYSTSMDDANKLALPGWVWAILIDYELPGRARLHCAVPGGIDTPPVSVQVDAATPPLALCAAWLRAGA